MILGLHFYFQFIVGLGLGYLGLVILLIAYLWQRPVCEELSVGSNPESQYMPLDSRDVSIGFE